ncbi:MAG TPA: S8 family serine peptidase [Candidatus Binatia bacterium]|nr:S8 family serine peptidase [Candidatus Binatia bacterium]
MLIPRFIRCIAAVAIATAFIRGAAAAQAIGAEAAQQIQALMQEKAARSRVQRKIGSHLVYAAKLGRGEPIARGVSTLALPLQIDSGRRALVDIKADIGPTILEDIAALGGEVVNSFPAYRAIRAWLPLNAVETLAARDDVDAIHPAAKRVHRKLTTSEGDVAHRANLARARFGIDGTGVKIGVLSDSVDNLAKVQSTGDLGAVAVLPGLSGVPGSGEGTALLEIAYDLAPGASLFFATTGDTDASMATNIQALRAAGCDIIVDDIGFLDEPVFQDGVIAQAVDQVTADGALYISAAGNGGNENAGTSGAWEGDFVASSSVITVSGSDEVLHDFGGTVLNPMTAESNQPPVIISLQWSDAFGQSANDYDLFILSGNTVVAASTDSQSGTDDPIEAVDLTNVKATGLTVAVGRYSGEARFLHLDTNGGELAIHTVGEIYGHPTAEGAVAVAAVDAMDRTTPFTNADRVEWYSSDGPRRIFYQADGSPITPGNFLSTGGIVRQKPDVTAADCVVASTPGFNPFCGTSASSAHAAAIAALVKSAGPTLTASEVRAALTSTAIDIEAAGVDRDSGFGILDALAAVQVASAPAPTATSSPTPTPTPSPTRTHTPTRAPTPTGSRTPQACIGDCDQSGTVGVDDLVKGVDIALGNATLNTCPAFDCNGNGQVTVDCLVKGVNSALYGC